MQPLIELWLQLVDLGMDVSSIVDFTLLPYVERTVTDAKNKLLEAIRHRYRSQEEIELAMKFVDEASLNRTLTEMKQLGVSNLQSYIKGKFLNTINSKYIMFLYLTG